MEIHYVLIICLSLLLHNIVHMTVHYVMTNDCLMCFLRHSGCKRLFYHKCLLLSQSTNKQIRLHTPSMSSIVSMLAFVCIHFLLVCFTSTSDVSSQSTLKKVVLSQFTYTVLVALKTTFMLWICLLNKTNFLLCMGMRLSLPAWVYFYSNREKTRKKRTSLKGKVRVGCVHKLRADKTSMSVWSLYRTM